MTAEANTVAEFKSKIAPELQAQARPIADAQPHPDNARKHNLPRIARSLAAHGQRSVIVVQQSTGYIVKGNGTWTAAAQILGWTEIAQSWQDLNDEEALAYLLADNKASDEASYDTPKLVKALNKLVDGPGLMDSLWSNEELEDQLEAEAGPVVLEGDVAAGFAETEEQLAARSTRTVTKHKEVPLVMTLEDHAAFVERLKVLKKLYGISGNVDAVVEAVKRQADAEDGAVQLGRESNELERYRIRRELVTELRDLLLTDPRYEQLDRTMMLGILEAAEPFREVVSPLRQVPGQTEAFPELGTPVDEDAPSPSVDDEEADAQAALEAYRQAGIAAEEGGEG